MIIIDKLKALKLQLINMKILMLDFKQMLKFSSGMEKVHVRKATLERDLIVLSHTIEKGLSHKNIKPLFGRGIVKSLLENLNLYIKYKDLNRYYVVYASSILKKYIETNINVGVSKSDLPIILDELNEYVTDKCGAYRISEKDFFAPCLSNFTDLAKARHSVRLYDTKSDEIEKDVIKKCIDVAQLSPSACNRQATRVHVIYDKKKIKELSNIQGGARGFGENSGVMVIITQDLRYYYAFERRIPMYDAGLFSMTFIYALFENRIGSCVLNGSLSLEQERHVREIVDIAPCEMIASFIVLSKIPKNQSIGLAKSYKKSSDEITYYVDDKNE